ncbi:heterokaryon incompatibility protein-domain-containing protein [Hypoxylon rubiginosum]|uniref:Heterokaryon incompatibility protein-domain-containing protein n=1 Tax=Hypoxylon rubiginosum TaxID=110542 RepID=A0ACB9YKG1_9PEZI|nr:heterokaryon incompatibility protein-domain-containing protein [Hypoxylon rubiginosum]
MELFGDTMKWHIRTGGTLIRVVAEPANEAYINGDVAGILLNYTGSTESLELVGSWFRSCCQNHDKCRKTLEGETLETELKLPTRVLYIGSIDDGSVRLVETRNPSGRWAALSHCWGDKQPIYTTRANLQRHRKGIPLSDLPRTFRDAVAITRSLGLDYLWVDTLCIVQRDPDDWKREAPKMGQVYEQAEIVIAAAGSSNAYQGCFSVVQVEPLVELPYIKNGVIAGQLFAVKELVRPNSRNVFRPLSGRAWTIQERVLARRTLYYTENGIWWNCRHFGATCFRHDGFSFEDIQLTPRQQSWTGLLTQYLNCALSISTDNLQAIDGIAGRMACRRPDRYYHGCWMNDLPEQLIWYGKSPRPPELKARPSRSWSSTAMGTRIFLDERASKNMTNLYGPFKPYLSNGLQARCFVYSPVILAKPKVIDYSLKMDLNLLVGNMRDDSPEIVQRGNSLAAVVKKEEDEIPDDLLYLIPNEKNQAVGVAVMDDVSWFSQKVYMESDLSLVLLAGSPNWRWRDRGPVASDQKSLHYGLLTLRRHDGQNSHCRVGFAVVYSRTYAEQARAQNIVLV